METVAIAAHVPRQVAAGIRVRTAAVADIQRRAAVDIQLPVAAEVDIQLPVVAEAVAEVEVGSTPPEATTGLITDDKNFELLPGGPPSRPLFCLLFLSL
jgi:hypothetical protein